MTSLWLPLIAQPRIPRWKGPRLVHTLPDEAPKPRKPVSRWKAWTLLLAGVNDKPMSAKQVAACWPLLDGARL